MPKAATKGTSVGDGIQYEHLAGDRWRFRWRERTEAGAWRSRECVFRGAETGPDGARAHAERIRSELRTTGAFSPTRHRLSVAPPSNLAAGITAYIEARKSAGKFKPKTVNTYTSYMLRVLEHIHQIYGVPETQPLPVTVLTRETFQEIMRRDRATGISEVTAYSAPLLVLKAWQWMADEPTCWPHIPPAPRDTTDFLPRTPKYSRTVAPSLAHVDACLRQLKKISTRSTLILGVFLRFTGLRADTILSIKREDIDLRDKMLQIRVDKNNFQRLVPLSDALIAEVSDWLSLFTAGTIFPKRRHLTTDRATPHKKPSETFKAAWRAATEEGEVPLFVWAPDTRKNARPEHALRAAFDAYLLEKGVSAPDLDYLVGRNETDVRAVHYSGDRMQRWRDAVNMVPPVDWLGPRDLGDNVVRLAR